MQDSQAPFWIRKYLLKEAQRETGIWEKYYGLERVAWTRWEGDLPWQEGVAARLYPSAYSKVERVYSLQFQSGKFSLGKSSEEGDTRAGGTECVSSEVRWGSRRAAHNGKRSLHGGGGSTEKEG